MIRIRIKLILLICLFMASCKTVTENTEPVSFNEGWKFHKGEAKKAATTLGYIQGDIPSVIHNEYNYLATLINIRNKNLSSVEKALNSVMKGSVFEPYLILTFLRIALPTHTL